MLRGIPINISLHRTRTLDTQAGGRLLAGTEGTPRRRHPMAGLRLTEELLRRTGTTGNGFDGIGATVLDFENVGGHVHLVNSSPAPQPEDPFNYANMIVRMANEYDSRFHSI